MSWNTSRILNDLEYEINQNKQDISMLEQKTLYISDQLSLDGTVFVNNVYSEAFVKNGGTSTQYLMADGSTTSNSQQGQPNIYLYNNNNSGTPAPTSGQIRANDPNNQNVTELYISHITSDGIDIDVFLQQITTISVIYLQDRNNSNNNVRFNVTGAIIDTPNSYVTVPVLFDIAQGSGSIDFGDGHPLFMSIFDNSQLIDSRISAVETKTQHQSATSLETRFNSPINMFDHKIYNVADPVDLNDVSNKKYVDDTVVNLNTSVDALENKTQNQTGSTFSTTFSKNVQVRLPDGSGDRFTVTNDASPLQSLKFQVSQDSVQINLPLIMGNENRIEELGAPINPKDATTKQYVDDAVTNGRIALETKTQNQNADLTGTTFQKNTSVVLRVADGDFFTVRNDDSPFSVSKLNVSNTSVQINSVPLFMQGQRIRDIGAPVDITDATRKSYVDGLITPLQTTTQNQTGNSGGTTFQKNMEFTLRSFDGDVFDVRNDDIPSSVSKLRVNNTSVRINSVPLIMQGQRIQDVGAPTTTSDVASIGTLTAGSVPYFTSTNRLSGASKNLFVQLGDSTIQSAIDAITLGGAVGGSVQLSSGSSAEDVICVKQNYTLVGAICPPYTQTTQITGNLTIGSSGFVSTRVRVSHMKFVGNLIFDDSTNQQLRTYFYNCDWNGTITFPTAAATGTNTTQIFFDSCTFSGIGGFTIPNQSLYQIFFTRCNFIGQLITNQQPVGNSTRTVFTDCAYLPTLSSLGNCILNGLNTSTTVTQGNFNSIVLAGTATSLLRGNGTTLSGTASQFVKANATLDSSAYTTIVSGTFTATFGTVVNAVFTYRYVFDGTTKIVTLGIPHIRSTITGGPLPLFSSTGNALPAIIRPATESVSSIRLVVAGVFEAGYIILASNGLISFAKVATAWANSALAVNGSGNSAPGDYMYITYVA